MAEAEDIFEQTLSALRTQLRNLRRLKDALTRRQEARSLLETMRNARTHNPDIDRAINNDPDRASQWGEIERQIQQLREDNDRLQQENAQRQAEIERQQADLDRQPEGNLDGDHDRVPDDVEERHEASDDARREEGRRRDREEQERGPDPAVPVAAAAGTAAAADELNDERDELNSPDAEQDVELGDDGVIRPAGEQAAQQELNGADAQEVGGPEAQQDVELGDDGVIRPAGEQARQPEVDERQGGEFVDADGATPPVIGEDQQAQGPAVDQPAQQVQADGQQQQPGQQGLADRQHQPGAQVQAQQQPVERVLDEQRAERAQGQNGQQPGARPNGMTPDEIGRNQHVANAGTSPATGATVPPREDALTGGRGGQTPARQHQQSVNRGGRGSEGPGLGE
ncbi:hypothetical protein E1218_22375 [Kribbella turkmenica]|uniref:Uncharacterized protein n=1 Tax=Kribbella turkmenica TaxID=2530375 RepID=A0A4V6PD35_9ACTN|nr:hypothetical protein [Kribbella turkmenica]TDD20507.1 hypothetical protein E1218_22375 [Kribbella turkmenica]